MCVWAVVDVCVYGCVCMCVCMDVYVCVYGCVCMCMCMCVSVLECFQNGKPEASSELLSF